MNLKELLLYIVDMPEDVKGFIFALISAGMLFSVFVYFTALFFDFLFNLLFRWLDKKFPVDREDKK